YSGDACGRPFLTNERPAALRREVYRVPIKGQPASLGAEVPRQIAPRRVDVRVEPFGIGREEAIPALLPVSPRLLRRGAETVVLVDVQHVHHVRLDQARIVPND